MNFLLGNLHGNDDDYDYDVGGSEEGWDDDADDIDLDDDDDDVVDDYDPNNHNEEEEDLQQHQRSLEQGGGGGTIQMGTGLLMGRLTRFIDAVTSPDLNYEQEEEEDDDENGEYNDGGDGSNDGYDGYNNDESGWQDDDDGLDDLIIDNDDNHDVKEEEEQPFESSGNGNENGWEDDPDIITDSEVDGNQTVNVNDDGDVGEPADTDITATSSSTPPPTIMPVPNPDISLQTSNAVVAPSDVEEEEEYDHDDGNGWDDDLNLSTQLMNTSTFTLGTSFQQQNQHLPPNIVPQVQEDHHDQIIMDQSVSGWDDDDVHLELDEDNDNDDDNEDNVDVEDDDNARGPTITPTPPPPPPPPPPQHLPAQHRVSSVTIGSSLMSSMGTLPGSETIDEGWDDDGGDLEDLEDTIEETQQTNFTAATIPPPPPPPPSPVKSHPPPPPPPPPALPIPNTRESSAGASTIPSVSFAEQQATVASSTNPLAVEEGWDDDALLDDVEEMDGQDEIRAATPKVVDSVPPPPPPSTNGTNTTFGGRTDAAIMNSAHPSLEEGWEDDDVDGLDDDDDDANKDLNTENNDEANNESNTSNRIIFDHIPHPTEVARYHTTVDATCQDDDISRDDTLSMTNSRSYHQQQQQYSTSRLSNISDQDNNQMVNWTPEEPSFVPLKDNTSGDGAIPIVSASFPAAGSMAVLHGENDGNSTIDSYSVRSGMGDSITTASTTNTGGAGSSGFNLPVLTSNGSMAQPLSSGTGRIAKPRRMVDFTPRVARGTSGDASLAVAGHTSVGESLDSIDEVEETDDSDNDDVLKEFLPSNPAIAETAIQRVDGASSNDIPPLTLQEEGEDGINDNININDTAAPLVNAIPDVPKALRRSVTGASVEVLSDSSESGDLGEFSDVGSIKDDLYGPMVSHIPQESSIIATETPTPMEDNDPDIVEGVIIHRPGIEDDTVVGHADKDVENDIHNDDEMDDESSKGESSTFGMTSVTMGTFTDDTRSLLSGRLPVVDETQHLVDFVPHEPPHRMADASTVVLMDDVSESSRVTDNVNDDPRASEGFGPVVSHIPSVPRRAPSATTSVITQISGLARDIKEDDEMDNTTIGFGERVATGSTGDGDELLDEQEDADIPLGNGGDHIVDMVPPGRRSRGTLDASVRVLVDIDEDLTQVGTINEEVAADFGPVVSHIPTANAPRSVAESMLTQVNADAEQDDDLDGGTWFGASTVGASSAVVGGASSEGDASEDGWEVDAQVLENLGSPTAPENQLPHVVDHVPDQRPSLGPADPSLIVNADPSEMSSQVDDFNQDEQNFGPVVDSLPSERILPPPAVGSTVVELPSVLYEDLEEIDEPDEAPQQQLPNEWDTQLPNPQSGNDDDSDREQLVDFLPPPEEELQELVRDASSEMATVDEKSTLPAEDPREDDYGPVVDHLPTASQSSIGNASETPSDDRRGAASQRNIDSVAPNFSVGSKRKDDVIDEVLDEDEFGPVVDVLPSGSSRASLAPSRGGSTVDALGTVSEVEDDLNTRDGWDNDTIDLGELQGSPRTAAQRSNDDRSYTVTWGDGVFHQNSSSGQGNVSKAAGGNVAFVDAEAGLLPRSSLDETKFYDPEAAVGSNGWGDDSLTFDSSHQNIADADTPPSTPRSSAGYVARATPECRKCGGQNSVDCPCVQALIAENEGADNMVGTWKTPEGEIVKIDLQKLLEDETTKRILVEKECQALRQTIENLKAGRDALVVSSEQIMGREEEMISAISKWQDANSKLTEDVRNFETECERLRQEQSESVRELNLTRDYISALMAEKNEIQKREAVLSKEVCQLKKTLEEQKEKSASGSVLQEQIEHLRQEVASKECECSDLNSQLNLVQGKLTKAEAENFKHAKDIARMSREHTKAIATLEKRVEEYQKELEDVRRQKDACLADYEGRLSKETTMAQNLTTENSRLEKQLQILRSQQDDVVKDLNSKLLKKQTEIAHLQARLKTADEEKSNQLVALRTQQVEIQKLSSLSAQLERTSKERDSLKHDLDASEVKIKTMESDLRDVKSKLEVQSTSLAAEVDALRKNASMSEKEKHDFRREIDLLKEQLVEKEVKRSHLQNQLDSLQQSYATLQSASASSALGVKKEEAKLRQLEDELRRLREQHTSQSRELVASEREVEKFKAEVSRLGVHLVQKERLEGELQQARDMTFSQSERIRSLEGDLTAFKRDLAEKDQSDSLLRQEIKAKEAALSKLQNERNDLLSKIDDMTDRLTRFEAEREAFQHESVRATSMLESLQEQVDGLANERDHFKGERDMLEEENEEMLVQFGLLNEQMNETGSELERVMEELNLKSEQLLSRDNAIEEMEMKLRASEERAESLKTDLDVLASKNNGQADLNEIHRQELVQENEKLRGLVEDLTADRNRLASAMERMESEKSSLIETIESLRQQVDEILSSKDSKERDLQSIIDNLTIEKNEMAMQSRTQSDELDKANEKLRRSQAFEQEFAPLQERLSELESQLSQKEMLMQQKDGAIQDLQYQLVNARSAPAESAETKSLRRTILELEAKAAVEKGQLLEMETLCDETQQELTRTIEQLQSSEDRIQELQAEVETMGELESANRSLEERLTQLEQALHTSQAGESRYRDEIQSLRQQLGSLEMELRDSSRTYEQSAKEPSGQGFAEIETLRQQIELLKRNQLESSNQAGAREEMIEREVHTLQDQMREKDSQISTLQNELQSLARDLSHSDQELASKNDHVQQLSSELEMMRLKLLEPAPTNNILDQAQDEAESVEEMRSHIISLAQALEKSENRRADIIERIEKERQANADSLRRMTESVKRFYSTLNFGDTT
ncbi:hypothetical protein IV203_032071 [Nitzschia inconspicua]|uniref:Uncharacterized protein n=1 Tax=Nitzschia inconspicua TaxID=303405 RepID=A0A9K3K7Q5_9STRA|nr:hypothetical protein IV203_011267 [Nitzschia inconspicua]KAG7369328.1 hypothetical protein IV203_032071 [Nitzschia inconspicua]